jgi:hypothetical protein
MTKETCYSEDDIYQKAMDENWVGDGTSETPFVIENNHSLSHHSKIEKSSLHLLIKNCAFNAILLKKCKNLEFEGCSFEYMTLSKCSEIVIGNCSFKNSLALRGSHDLYIRDSRVPFLIFSVCYKNNFKACTIANIFNYFSRGNVFENIEAPKKFQDKVEVGMKKYYKIWLVLITAGIISLISAIFISDFSDWMIGSLIIGLYLMAFISFITPIALYLDYRTMKHYPDNKFIKS